MKHIIVYLNNETQKLDLALLWPFLAPIGPRLEKQLPMPQLAATGYDDIRLVMAVAQVFEHWLVCQSEEMSIDKYRPMALVIPSETKVSIVKEEKPETKEQVITVHQSPYKPRPPELTGAEKRSALSDMPPKQKDLFDL